MAEGELAGDGQADDSGADDDDVTLAGRLIGRHAARLVGPSDKPPVKPQLASRKQLPRTRGWAYEPKYDGFRALAFVDGTDLFLQSRTGRPLARYFPEPRFPRPAAT